jgi:hypothetical protein
VPTIQGLDVTRTLGLFNAMKRNLFRTGMSDFAAKRLSPGTAPEGDELLDSAFPDIPCLAATIRSLWDKYNAVRRCRCARAARQRTGNPLPLINRHEFSADRLAYILA